MSSIGTTRVEELADTMFSGIESKLGYMSPVDFPTDVFLECEDNYRLHRMLNVIYRASSALSILTR
jgi:hypothetical protein